MRRGYHRCNSVAALTQLTSICLDVDSTIWAFEPIRSLPHLKIANLEYTEATATTPLLAKQHLTLLCLKSKITDADAPVAQVCISQMNHACGTLVSEWKGLHSYAQRKECRPFHLIAQKWIGLLEMRGVVKEVQIYI